jgi:hypothetical protein
MFQQDDLAVLWSKLIQRRPKVEDFLGRFASWDRRLHQIIRARTIMATPSF